jgi:DNA replication protein DnaC
MKQRPLITEPACKVCSDTGWEVVIMDESTRREGVRHCQTCDFWAQALGVCPGMPVGEKDLCFEHYLVVDGDNADAADNRDAVRHARMLVSGTHSGLYIVGEVGSGKSGLACACLNELGKARVRCRFVRLPELLIDGAEAAGEEALEPVKSTPVVVLDDIGAHQATDFARRWLQTVIDARVDRGLRTIFTSNLDLDGLKAMLEDDRVSSRIAGHCKQVKIKGVRDWRMPQHRAASLAARKPPPKR